MSAIDDILDELENRYDGADDSTTIWMGRHIDALTKAKDELATLRAELAEARAEVQKVNEFRERLAGRHRLACDERDAALAKLNDAEVERDDLAYWKESAMAVEREWDAQYLARLLGGPQALGKSCRKVIAAEVPKLIAERDEARRNLEEKQKRIDWLDAAFNNELGTTTALHHNLNTAREALKSIATPALGGKQQQYTAQAALRAIGL